MQAKHFLLSLLVLGWQKKRLSTIRPMLQTIIYMFGIVILISGCDVTPNNQSINTTSSPSNPPQASAEESCQVNVLDLQLRIGPGNEYQSLRLLQQDSQLSPIGRDETGTWIEVQIRDTGENGWVNINDNKVVCDISLVNIPVGNIPPIPTISPSIPTPTTINTSLPTSKSPLKKNDIPPSGVAPLLQAFSGGAGAAPCYKTPDGSLKPVIVPFDELIENTIRVNSMYLLCFHEFAPSEPLEVQLVSPNGQKHREQIKIDDGGNGEWSWLVLPGSPIGKYTITGTQGTRQASSTFIVSLASEPSIRILTDKSGKPGTIFKIAMAGFIPNEKIILYLYREVDLHTCGTFATNCYKYLTILSVDKANERGELIYELVTQVDDPLGTYYISDHPFNNTIGTGHYIQTFILVDK